jgi:hypothetical protein
MAELQSFRAYRTGELIDTLRSVGLFVPNPPSDANIVWYALCHHLVFRIRHLIQAGMKVEAASFIERTNDTRWVVPSSSVLVDAVACWLPPKIHYSSPPYIVDCASVVGRGPMPTWISQELNADVSVMPGGKPCEVGVVVLFGNAQRDPLVHRSYTLGQLPATVFLERCESEIQLRESLVHEATHCWFNDALKSSGSNLESESRSFFSPWKGVPRPAFSFLHAVVAFATVSRFHARESVNGRASGRTAMNTSARRSRETAIALDGIRKDVEVAIQLLESPDLREVVWDHYRHALDVAVH